MRKSARANSDAYPYENINSIEELLHCMLQVESRFNIATSWNNINYSGQLGRINSRPRPLDMPGTGNEANQIKRGLFQW
jgi:hypothetical protein